MLGIRDWGLGEEQGKGERGKREAFIISGEWDILDLALNNLKFKIANPKFKGD